jgi:HD-GYP domain-containing protein (c-di-GMP phosphodiesterase class II)
MVVVFFTIIILWSITITIYHSKQISNSIDNLITKDINKYSKVFKDIDLTVKNEKYESFIETIKVDLKKNNIVLANLYDENQNLLIEINDLNSSTMIASILKLNNIALIEKEYKIIPISENLIYLSFHKKLSINNKTYYLNIVKQLDTQTVNLIQKDIFTTIIIVFTTVVFIFLSIFPIIFTQYNNLLKKTDELLKSNLISIVSLGNAIAKRDSDTNAHNYRVTYYSIKIAEAHNLSKEQVQALIKGAFLHDIGKIAISDTILLKPGKLTKEEFEVMKTHVLHGVEIVKDDIWLQDAEKVIQNHHEKVDGSGYPNGLKGDAIPIEAKIFAVADVFDALTSKRPYKEAFDIQKSFGIIKNDIGIHFDENVVYKFEKIYEKIYYDILDLNSKELKDILYQNIKVYFDIKNY